jgi:hypothetical protein
VAELFYFAASPIVGGADYLKTFSPDQLNTLTLLSLKMSGYGSGIFMMFYGAGFLLLGYLIFRSGYLPRFLGVLLAITGVGFVTKTFVGSWRLHTRHHPSHAWAALSGLADRVVAREGVDVPKWHDKQVLPVP